jgi:hypothetical protein
MQFKRSKLNLYDLIVTFSRIGIVISGFSQSYFEDGLPLIFIKE